MGLDIRGIDAGNLQFARNSRSGQMSQSKGFCQRPPPPRASVFIVARKKPHAQVLQPTSEVGKKEAVASELMFRPGARCKFSLSGIDERLAR